MKKQTVMNTSKIMKALEAQSEQQAKILHEKVEALIEKSGLTGLNRAIYEEGIHAGIHLIPDILKSLTEVANKIHEEDTPPTRCS